MYGQTRGDDKSSENRVRYSVFRTIGKFKYYLKRLEEEKKEYINEAREAKKEDDTLAYQSAKSRLQLCLINSKLIAEMISQLEISLQIDSMDGMIESYNSCMNEFKKQRNLALNIQNAGKICRERKNDLNFAIGFYTELYDCLTETRGKGREIKPIISDAELERVIDADEIKDRDSAEGVIDMKIEMIKAKMREV